MEAMTLNDIINDLLLLVSFIIYFICSLAKLLLKNIKTLIAPSSLLHKNVENEIVLITGAGKKQRVFSCCFLFKLKKN